VTYKDNIVAGDKWKFDSEVTEVFDEMLERSIPDYLGMRRNTTELALRFAQPGTSIVDLGCSRGTGLRPIIDKLGKANSYIGVEVSEPMIEVAKVKIPEAEIVNLDLRDEYPKARASVTLSILTLQFVPIEYRQKIISNVYKNTVEGGVFLFVEKILGSDSYADELLVNTYLDRKGENGYTHEQIVAKRRSLEGVLVPVTSDWNVDLLNRAGFKHVDCYWRHLNFAAWVGVKE
jgi:tRNA (cmo5U34)-methyltransferase